MTTVVRAADAPRAASSIRSSSTRCSCTGATRGWIRKTSRSRQFACSCTSRQSLANRVTRAGSSGTARWPQISVASAGWAVPLHTATSRTGVTLRTGGRVGEPSQRSGSSVWRVGEVRVGLSGWRYREWRGRFYPPGLVQRRELEYVAERFDTVEINGSFYSLQRPSSYQRWAATVPPGFLFAVKGGRYITHLLRLRGVETPLANFFASGPLALGPALGPVLWQLPPGLGFDEQHLEGFLEMLPRTTTEAVRVAQGHDTRLDDRNWVTTDADRPLRHALEVRDESYRDPAFL